MGDSEKVDEAAASSDADDDFNSISSIEDVETVCTHTTNKSGSVFSSAFSKAFAKSKKRGSKHRKRESVPSLELRKVPDHILHSALKDDAESDLDKDEFEDEEKEDIKQTMGRDVLLRMCIRPQHPIRTQLMLSFGVISILAILFVIIVSIIGVITAD
eukprot:11066528-Ditylum_brightwellii.AAC.1